MWTQITPLLRLVLTVVVAAVFVWSVYLGLYHAGVEWKFWPGPTACTGGADTLDFSALNAINDVRVVPCDTPQFRFLGISFAGYNAAISALVVYFLLWSAKGQLKRMRSAKG
ncbi:Periplasmic thiol:disulfide oxidoreductase DsbB, required for DsbA reoxidation [hydrothermal vent metagenome]|uniref:Periplasmic thiol:disulfide oxidoreductase DsbB, required for DsbA reoxidation n=1 Tax=hydrothermal vent metagenome TaxID=652676 RepID=A0A3B0UK31_9ZZZZ